MTEYKHLNSTVRVHGTVDYDVLKTAAERFLKEVQKCKQAKLKATR